MRIKKEGVVLATLLAALSLSIMAWAVDCPTPDTGQTKCYDKTRVMTCPSPGQDFYGQDAQYPCNPQSYTKLDANGNDLPESATEWVMVRDNVTGLIWEIKTDDGSIHNKYNKYNWYDAQDVFIATLNSQNYGGHVDWRLPTIKELSFIRNIDAYDPAINTDYFPNTVSSHYWSSTSYVYSPITIFAWYVNFYSGTMGNYSKSFNDYVRAVRGGQCGSFDTSTTTIVASTTTITVDVSTTTTTDGDTTTTADSSTTTTIPSSCLSIRLYGKYSEETELLRYVRDEVLSKTPEGQEIIKLYYEWSPIIVKAMKEDEEFKEEVKEMIDAVLMLIRGEVE